MFHVSGVGFVRGADALRARSCADAVNERRLNIGILSFFRRGIVFAAELSSHHHER